MINTPKYFYIRQLVLERDNYKCVRCFSDKNLLVHHKDRSGNRGYYNEPNNHSENLETLCRPCHGKEHAKDRVNYTGRNDRQLYNY